MHEALGRRSLVVVVVIGVVVVDVVGDGDVVEKSLT